MAKKSTVPENTKREEHWGLLGLFGLLGLLGGLLIIKRKPPAPNIVLSDLIVTPTEAYKGQQVSVSCTATNASDVESSLNVIFKVEGVVMEQRLISLGPRQYDIIQFSTIAPEARIQPYTVNINELTGFFSVISNHPIAVRDIVVTGPSGASEIYEDEIVTFTATVMNLGNVTDSRSLTLYVDGYSQERSSGTLLPGESSEVKFSFAIADPGVYTATIELVSKSFEVLPVKQPPYSVIIETTTRYDFVVGKEAQHRSNFYAEENFFQLFYSDGGIYYTSSPNGKPMTWKEPVLVMSPIKIGSEPDWNMRYSPLHNKVDIVGFSPDQVMYLQGTPQLDGTILFQPISVLTTTPQTRNNPCIVRDIYGGVWIANSGNVGAVLDSTWQPVYQGRGTSNLLALPNGDVVHIFGYIEAAYGGYNGGIQSYKYDHVNEVWAPYVQFAGPGAGYPCSVALVGNCICIGYYETGFYRPGRGLRCGLHDYVTETHLDELIADVGQSPQIVIVSPDDQNNIHFFWTIRGQGKIYMRTRLTNGDYTDAIIVHTEPAQTLVVAAPELNFLTPWFAVSMPGFLKFRGVW